MIKVAYELYKNDYNRRIAEKTFASLNAFEDWFFGLCKGKYNDDISVPNPDNGIWSEGPSCMEVRCYSTDGVCYWIRMIQIGNGIMYTDGKLTNGMKHWNEDAKEMCRRMLKRKKAPAFNFI